MKLLIYLPKECPVRQYSTTTLALYSDGKITCPDGQYCNRECAMK